MKKIRLVDLNGRLGGKPEGGVAYWEGVGALTEEILGLNGGSGLLGWVQNKGLLRVHRSSPISFAGGQWMKPARDCIAGGDNQVRKRLSLGFSRFVWVGEDPRTGESPKKQTRAEVYFDLGPNGLSARSWFYVLDLRRTEFLRFAFSQLRGNFIKVEVLGTKKLPGHSMTNEAKRRRNEVRRIVGQGGETAADLFLSPLRTFEELMVSDGQVHLELRQETSTLIRGRPERIKLWGAELRARPFDLIFDQGPFKEFGQTR